MVFTFSDKVTKKKEFHVSSRSRVFETTRNTDWCKPTSCRPDALRFAYILWY